MILFLLFVVIMYIFIIDDNEREINKEIELEDSSHGIRRNGHNE